MRQSSVPREEVLPAAEKASTYGVRRHVVAAHADPLGDSGEGEVDCRQPQIRDVNRVADRTQSLETPDEAQARQSSLERKALTLSLQRIEPRQRQPTSFDRQPLGRKADSPCARMSALTNSSTLSEPRKSRGAAVDFPAPFGPPRTTTPGPLPMR